MTPPAGERAAKRHIAARVVDRLLDRRPTVRRAVLRISDQQRNVMPVVCAKSGEQTDHAMRITAIEGRHCDGWVIAIGQTASTAVARLRRRQVATIAIPVAERAWRTWQSRLRVSVVLTSVGAALGIVGAVRSIGTLIAVGVLAFVFGWLNRVRAWHNAWLGFELRPANGEVVVSRVHSAFDAEAAEIYRRSVMRR